MTLLSVDGQTHVGPTVRHASGWARVNDWMAIYSVFFSILAHSGEVTEERWVRGGKERGNRREMG